MFFAEQLRPTDLRATKIVTTPAPDPPNPGRPKEATSDDDDRLAA
jgi:hypothetical protein